MHILLPRYFRSSSSEDGCVIYYFSSNTYPDTNIAHLLVTVFSSVPTMPLKSLTD